MNRVTIFRDFGAPPTTNKVSYCFHCFPIFMPWSDGTRCHESHFECWVSSNLNHSHLLLSSRSSVVLPMFSHMNRVICISDVTDISPSNLDSKPCFIQCGIVWWTLHVSSIKSLIVQPWNTPFPTWNKFVVPFPFLTVASWPEYRFLRRHVKYSSSPMFWRILNVLLWSA